MTVLSSGCPVIADEDHGFRGIRVAVILEGSGRDTDRQFFKDVAANRGANVRYFASVDEATNWLGSY